MIFLYTHTHGMYVSISHGLLQVQVRQKAINKKTFFYLEQLILKHKAHEQALGIKPIHGKCI